MWGRPDNSNDTLKDYKFGKSIFHSKSVKFVVIYIILHYFNFIPCFKAEVKKTNIKTNNSSVLLCLQRAFLMHLKLVKEGAHRAVCSL